MVEYNPGSRIIIGGKPCLKNAFHFVNTFLYEHLTLMAAQTVIENNEGHGLLTKDIYNKMADVHKSIFPQKLFPLRRSKQVRLIFYSLKQNISRRLF